MGPGWHASELVTPRSAGRLLFAVIALEVAAIGLLDFWSTSPGPPADPVSRFAADFRVYMAVTREWLGGGPFYQPWQLAGPYDLPGTPFAPPTGPPILYPPYALVLFVPFALVPETVSMLLWFVIPVTVTGWSLVRLRPAPWAWPIVAAAATWSQSLWLLVSGNPAALWGTAALALGAVYGWPALGVLIRPTALPLAVIGIHRRSWWVAAAVGALVSLAFLPMWPDYIVATLNARGASELYLYQHYVLAVVVLGPWLSSRAGWRAIPAWLRPARRSTASG